MKKLLMMLFCSALMSINSVAAFAAEAQTCPDATKYLCIEVKADTSVDKIVNVGVFWSRKSMNPLWDEYGNYSSFIGNEKFIWAVTPMDYITSHKFTQAEYVISRINNQPIYNCAYQSNDIKPSQYTIKINRDNKGIYHCVIAQLSKAKKEV